MYGEMMLLAVLFHVAPTEDLLTKAGFVLLHPAEQRVVERTNAERRRHGLRELQVDKSLMRSARRHTAWMTNARTLRHTSAAVAENIAMGQQNGHEAVNSWMNSSGHRANILSPSHTRIGVAAYTAADGTVYWCQQFLR